MYKHLIIPHTSAIIPPGCQYDSQQLEYFGTPAAMEANFYRFYGHMIPDNYVLKLQTFLRNIHLAIVRTHNDYQEEKYKTGTHLKCEVVGVDLWLLAPKCIQLSSIFVRPCAERLGILKMVFWQIIKTCEHLGMSFMIGNPLPKTQAFLKRFGNIVFNDEDRRQALTANSNMHWITPELVNIGDKLLFSDGQHADYELILNSSAFPSADVFNDGIDPREAIKLAIEARQRFLAAQAQDQLLAL
jgi:hypothetical protein